MTRRIRESTRRLLARMGLDVLTASTGEEALAIFDEHGSRIRVVVRDVVATGYAADECVRELFAAGARVIEKPFAAADLRREVTKLLEPVAAPPALLTPSELEGVQQTVGAAPRSRLCRCAGRGP